MLYCNALDLCEHSIHFGKENQILILGSLKCTPITLEMCNLEMHLIDVSTQILLVRKPDSDSGLIEMHTYHA